jgi:WD40 repeat protein
MQQPSSSIFSRPGLFVAVSCLLVWAGCGGDAAPPATNDSGDGAALADPFPSSPPDGAIAPAAATMGDYQPTAATAPSTDIWLASLVVAEGGVSVEDLRNVTDRDGYDNQPSFSPDGEAVYYAAAVDSQTEVFRYNIPSDGVEQVTHTSGASEFSPLFIPGQDAFSVTHEAQDLQHLWRHESDGSEMGPVLGTARPVGYHAWADQEWVAMFILGDAALATQATLQVGNALTGDLRVIVENPGRSIHRIPGTDRISFVHKISDDEWSIESLDPVSGEHERLTLTLPGREDYAWTPDGGILMGDGQTLHIWRADAGWSEVADLSADGRGEISRLAVSPDGTLVAIVMNRGG